MFRRPDGSIRVLPASIVDAKAGRIQYTINSPITDIPGTVSAHIRVYKDGGRLTWGEYVFTVRAQLAG